MCMYLKDKAAGRLQLAFRKSRPLVVDKLAAKDRAYLLSRKTSFQSFSINFMHYVLM